jgi:hypothetical protein
MWIININILVFYMCLINILRIVQISSPTEYANKELATFITQTISVQCYKRWPTEVSSPRQAAPLSEWASKYSKNSSLTKSKGRN